MVGILLDGREHGLGSYAFAEDLAGFLARDGEPTHLFVLTPTAVKTPRIVRTLIRAGRPAARLDEFSQTTASASLETSNWTPREFKECTETLADQLVQHVARHELTALHVVGLDLAAAIAQIVHQRTGIPFFVTPRGHDLNHPQGRSQSRAQSALVDSQAVITFDQQTKRSLETQFPEQPGQSIDTRVLPRGIDRSLFKPLARTDRAAACEDYLDRNEIRDRLEGIDWDHGYTLLTVEPKYDRHGFEEFLFAIPELLRLQNNLQIIVVGECKQHADGLRAAMTAGRPELLSRVMNSSELCQPLVDHLERLHQEGRAESWWSTAGRIEPERRIRFLGKVSRQEFATLLRASDLFVLTDTRLRPPSQMLYEALGCGVLPLASELAGIDTLAKVIGEEISAEFASLCILRTGVQPVREMEEKIGRIVRLRPNIAESLARLATTKFNSQQMAASLRRIYEKRPTGATLQT